MTDRELLELAAKAAGLDRLTKFSKCISDYDSPHCGGEALHEDRVGGECASWNPLTDDGDALRLAVRLRIDLFNYGPPLHDEAYVDAIHMDGTDAGNASEFLHDDSYAATRRAIVRAAAEIGKGMQ